MILSAKNRSGYHEFDVDIRKGELIPANDPAEMLKDAFRTELKSRGFAIGSGGNVILINLSSWHGEYFVTTPWSGSAIASMELDVTIKRADGSVVFKRSISGGSASWLAAHPPPQGENKPVAEAAEAALQQVVANVLSDPQFLDALKQ